MTNQPPRLVGHDVLGSDAALVEAVERYADAGAVAGLSPLGLLAGSEGAARLGDEADANPPVLRTHDRYGHRVDEVDFHPSWHSLMNVAVSHGLAGAAWRDISPSAHLRRAAGFVVWSQVEAGHGCPVSMTYAAVGCVRLRGGR